MVIQYFSKFINSLTEFSKDKENCEENREQIEKKLYFIQKEAINKFIDGMKALSKELKKSC